MKMLNDFMNLASLHIHQTLNGLWELNYTCAAYEYIMRLEPGDEFEIKALHAYISKYGDMKAPCSNSWKIAAETVLTRFENWNIIGKGSKPKTYCRV